MERSQEGMANILWWRWFGRRWVSDVHVQAGQVTNRCTRPTARFTLGPRDKSFLTKSCCDSGSRPTSPDRVASLPRLIAPVEGVEERKGRNKNARENSGGDVDGFARLSRFVEKSICPNLSIGILEFNFWVGKLEQLRNNRKESCLVLFVLQISKWRMKNEESVQRNLLKFSSGIFNLEEARSWTIWTIV